MNSLQAGPATHTTADTDNETVSPSLLLTPFSLYHNKILARSIRSPPVCNDSWTGLTRSVVNRQTTRRIQTSNIGMFLMPRPHRMEHYVMMTVVCPSVRPFVCLVPDCKSITEGCIASWKLAGGKPMTRVTRDPIQRSKGQSSRSPGRLMLKRKISQIFGMGRLTNFKLGVRMENDAPHLQHARWPQRSKVKVITWHRQFDARLPITGRRKKRIPTQLTETLYTVSRAPLRFVQWTSLRS